MHYELIAIAGVIVCAFVLCAEYIWLFVLAEKQEDEINKHNQRHDKLENMISGILSSGTPSSMKDELGSLRKYSHSDSQIEDLACTMLLKINKERENMVEGKQKNLDLAIGAVDPVGFYSDMLAGDNVYKKGYACRRLADFKANGKIENIRELVDSKKRDLSYNAAMALSQLGDRDGVSEFIINSQKDAKYSYRIIVEMLAVYTGDLVELVRPLLDECEEYMRSNLIKGVAKYKLYQLKDTYLNGIKSSSAQLKIASTKALAALEDPEYIHELIVLSNDLNWVVRGSAIKGLSAFKTPEAVEAVLKGVNDKDWWVRQISAGAIVKMDENLNHVENIIKGYDRYASEAVKYSLYKTYSMNEEETREV